MLQLHYIVKLKKKKKNQKIRFIFYALVTELKNEHKPKEQMNELHVKGLLKPTSEKSFGQRAERRKKKTACNSVKFGFRFRNGFLLAFRFFYIITSLSLFKFHSEWVIQSMK